MIRYALGCDAGHRFESWFGDSAGFDDLAARGLVSCPLCGSTRVGKSIMAPAVSRLPSAARHAEGPGGPVPAPDPNRPAPSGVAEARQETPGGLSDDAGRALRAMVRAARARALAATQDVGVRFPEEVRRMHDGTIPHRDIRGEATIEEARSLLEEGIAIMPVPGEPDGLN